MLPEDFIDPELPPIEDSEIEAAVDVTVCGSDNIFRPIFIGQSNGEMIQLTLSDAVRLKEFLDKAIPFVEQYNDRILQ